MACAGEQRGIDEAAAPIGVASLAVGGDLAVTIAASAIPFAESITNVVWEAQGVMWAWMIWRAIRAWSATILSAGL